MLIYVLVLIPSWCRMNPPPLPASYVCSLPCRWAPHHGMKIMVLAVPLSFPALTPRARLPPPLPPISWPEISIW